MAVAELVPKPNLMEIEDSDGLEGVEHAIFDYHRAIVEAPVQYRKNEGPQRQIEGQWLGGSALITDEADLSPHRCAIDDYDEADAFDLDHIEALLAGEDPEPHTSRLNRALRWIWPLIGEMPYGWWTSGAVPSGQPAWGENRPCPGRDTLRRRTVFCAGVPNLLLRSVGKRVPTYGNTLYDGGTYAYGIYFRGFSLPFSVSRVEPGDLLLDFYSGSAHQGHVAVVLNGRVLLQSYDGNRYMEGGYNGPGMTKGIHVATSAQYNNYDIIVRRQNWIDYAGDQTHRAVA